MSRNYASVPNVIHTIIYNYNNRLNNSFVCKVIFKSDELAKVRPTNFKLPCCPYAILPAGQQCSGMISSQSLYYDVMRFLFYSKFTQQIYGMIEV